MGISPNLCYVRCNRKWKPPSVNTGNLWLLLYWFFRYFSRCVWLGLCVRVCGKEEDEKERECMSVCVSSISILFAWGSLPCFSPCKFKRSMHHQIRKCMRTFCFLLILVFFLHPLRRCIVFTQVLFFIFMPLARSRAKKKPINPQTVWKLVDRVGLFLIFVYVWTDLFPFYTCSIETRSVCLRFCLEHDVFSSFRKIRKREKK